MTYQLFWHFTTISTYIMNIMYKKTKDADGFIFYMMLDKLDDYWECLFCFLQERPVIIPGAQQEIFVQNNYLRFLSFLLKNQCTKRHKYGHTWT